MICFKTVGIISGLLASYLIPTYILYRKNIRNIIIKKLNFLNKYNSGINDMLIKTDKFKENNYVLRRDTVEYHDKRNDEEYIIPINRRIPKIDIEISNNLITDLNINDSTHIIGFNDVNIFKMCDNKKEMVCKLDALRENDYYIVAYNKNTNNVLCIAEPNELDRLKRDLQYQFGYYEVFWYIESALLGLLFGYYIAIFVKNYLF